MTYAQFVQFIMRFLWREGDPVLEADIAILIGMAEDRITRDLFVQEMENAEGTLTATSQSVALPVDCKTPRSVFFMDTGIPLAYVPLFEIARQRSVAPTGAAHVFSLSGGKLLLAGPMSVENPLELGLIYKAKCPSLELTGTSWLLEKGYRDLFTYATLMHAVGYLREDPRVQMWQSQYLDALESVRVDASYARYGDGQLIMPLPEGSA